MKALVCLAIGGVLLSGCAAKFSAVQVQPSRVKTLSQISPERTKWKLSVKNEGANDVFCKRISIRVIYDDPRDYLEKGEAVEVVSDKYLRGRQSISLAGSTPIQVWGKDVHIRSVSAIDPECTSATLDDFCAYADKTVQEREQLLMIGEQSRSESCVGLGEKVTRLMDSDPQNSYPTEIRTRVGR